MYILISRHQVQALRQASQSQSNSMIATAPDTTTTSENNNTNQVNTGSDTPAVEARLEGGLLMEEEMEENRENNQVSEQPWKAELGSLKEAIRCKEEENQSLTETINTLQQTHIESHSAKYLSLKDS